MRTRQVVAGVVFMCCLIVGSCVGRVDYFSSATWHELIAENQINEVSLGEINGGNIPQKSNAKQRMAHF